MSNKKLIQQINFLIDQDTDKNGQEVIEAVFSKWRNSNRWGDAE